MENFEVFTIAGKGEIGNKDGSENEATFYSPNGIAVRNDGTIIVADTWNSKIRGIDLDGNVFTIAGTIAETWRKGDKDGPVNEATFYHPTGIAVRNDGTIIVADSYNNKIRGIDPNGNVFTIAGTGINGNKDGPGNEATFYHPNGIAVRDDGTIIVSDTVNHKIRGIDPYGNVFTLAGTGRKEDKDGPGNEASFNTPRGIAIDNDGTIIVADTWNRKIRGIDLDGNVFTIAGTGRNGDKDGPGNEATFCYPNGIAIKNDGTTIIVSDTRSCKIREIDPDRNVYTISDLREKGDEDEPGNEATPSGGIAIKNDGTIMITDIYNHKIIGIRMKKLTKSAME